MPETKERESMAQVNENYAKLPGSYLFPISQNERPLFPKRIPR